VGVERDGPGLAAALDEIPAIEKSAATPAARNMASAALLIAAAAAARQESRGGHFRADFPAADPRLAHRSEITLQEARRIAGA
ncbi:MAG: L-aspartate oxidase, partial [Methylobacteriaceae bacterium]|nr:L-aspartate oxidase [Methylobacteriaceae bacterium]